MVKGPENAQRKDTIKRSVFDQHEKTLLETDFIIWKLKPLKSYTVEFQSRAVGIHKYNDRQHDLVTDSHARRFHKNRDQEKFGRTPKEAEILQD